MAIALQEMTCKLHLQIENSLFYSDVTCSEDLFVAFCIIGCHNIGNSSCKRALWSRSIAHWFIIYAFLAYKWGIWALSIAH